MESYDSISSGQTCMLAAGNWERNSDAVHSPFAVDRTAMIRPDRPRRRSCLDASSPRPLVDPVTMATLPSRFVSLGGHWTLVQNCDLRNKVVGLSFGGPRFHDADMTIVKRSFRERGYSDIGLSLLEQLSGLIKKQVNTQGRLRRNATYIHECERGEKAPPGNPRMY